MLVLTFIDMLNLKHKYVLFYAINLCSHLLCGTSCHYIANPYFLTSKFCEYLFIGALKDGNKS